MWREFQEKAKIELFHAMFFAKISLMEESDVPTKLDEFSPEKFLEKLPSKAILSRWETIINLFIEHKLL